MSKTEEFLSKEEEQEIVNAIVIAEKNTTSYPLSDEKSGPCGVENIVRAAESLRQ